MSLPNNGHRSGRLRAVITAMAAALCLISSATAQLMVDLKLNKNLYVAYEPVNAEITVSNRAGRDIVLGGPAGSSWLSFDVATDQGDPILPAGARPVAGSTVLGAGKSHTINVSLGKFYPLGTPRNYRVKASVYFSGTSQYIGSRPRLFGVTEARTVWQQVIGIPRGKPGGGGYRHYSLLIFRDTQRTLLYVRVRDQKTKRVLASYSLGRIIEVRDPQATIDGDNRLHVLFLGAPRTFSHKVIDYGGETLLSDVYRSEGRAPQLMLGNTGKVQVMGGAIFNPANSGGVDALRGMDNLPTSREPETLRKLSDRPENMPYFGE
ncbi:MAG: hypothetical protein ACI9R3_000535 [Verrucomicrobiales bacterium]|jgi:hypothetical protein